MRRRDVSERGTVVENVVPREWKVFGESRFRSVFQEQIRNEPGVMLKLVRRKRLLFRKALDYIRCCKNRRRIYQFITVIPASFRSLKAYNVCASIMRNNRNYDL